MTELLSVMEMNGQHMRHAGTPRTEHFVWTVAGKSTPGPERNDDHVGLVCYSTETFRELARTHVRPGDKVLEIGASYGMCTCILAQATGDPRHVIGLETGKEAVERARETCKGVRFSKIDCLREPFSVILLVRELLRDTTDTRAAPERAATTDTR
jgi:hypothetical protein